MNNKDNFTRTMLKENLLKLNKQQLKLFYGMLVHAWASKKAFISSESFKNLWCELNYFCYMVDYGFPEPYDDLKLVKSYCQAHPYYFIDILCPELIISLFCEYMDDKIDVLATVAYKLGTEGLRAAYESCYNIIDFSESIDELVSQAEEHLKAFS